MSPNASDENNGREQVCSGKEMPAMPTKEMPAKEVMPAKENGALREKIRSVGGDIQYMARLDTVWYAIGQPTQ
ncbi:hypothetical protein UVI_02025270 [Ustilaginoidea virens]|uniref:Uncharacterized protein n=1 Tax=Ustilaginoidea virens TaxID=1159556 RepID=A0A1B5KR40_USTVR|nr:hypothetical protein UVI_02025270 [Ustilaginoidea virens]